MITCTRQNRQKLSEPRIQLWTDDTNGEFAIYLNSKYVVRTSQDAIYTKMIDESPCMQGYTYDWKHTLTHWVNFHYGNQVQVNISDASPEQVPESVMQNTKIPKIKPIRYYLKPSEPRSCVKGSKGKSKPEGLKCHFCNLKYFVEAERREHEKFWHDTK